jgi:RNA polymerase sigma-70 factor (ECF subfamily)
MNDADLIRLLKNDSDLGLSELMKRYTGIVCHVVKYNGASLLSSEDIEECAGDVFYEFYKNARRYRPERGSIKTMLCVMAKHKAIDAVRKKARDTVNVSIDDEENFLQFSDDFSIDEELFAKEVKDTLFAEISALGEPDREIIMRKFFFREPTASIAERLGLSTSNVDTRTHRALKKLKEKIGG